MYQNKPTKHLLFPLDISMHMLHALGDFGYDDNVVW